jgi:hypothetical protein
MQYNVHCHTRAAAGRQGQGQGRHTQICAVWPQEWNDRGTGLKLEIYYYRYALLSLHVSNGWPRASPPPTIATVMYPLPLESPVERAA